MVFSCLLRLDLKLLYNCSQRDMVTLAAYRNEIKQWTRFHPFDRLHPFCQWWDIFLSVIQSIKKRQLNNIVRKDQIAEGPKFHHLLQRMMAKYAFKRNHLIASIVVKIIYWIGAMHYESNIEGKYQVFIKKKDLLWMFKTNGRWA